MKEPKSSYNDESYTRVTHYLLFFDGLNKTLQKNNIPQEDIHNFFKNQSKHSKTITNKINDIVGVSVVPLEVGNIIATLFYQTTLIAIQTDEFFKFKNTTIPAVELLSQLHSNAKKSFIADLLSLINNQTVTEIAATEINYKKYVKTLLLHSYTKNPYYNDSFIKDRKNDLEKVITFFNNQELNVDIKIKNFLQYAFIETLMDNFFSFKNLHKNLQPNGKELFKNDCLSLFKNQTVDTINYKKYVPGCDQDLIGVNVFNQDRQSDIKIKVEFFNKKIAHIETLPFILKLFEVRNFLSLIHNSNCDIYFGHCIKRSGPIISSFNIDMAALGLLTEQQRQYIYTLREGNDKNSQLVKITPKWAKNEWSCYPTKAREDENIKNIEIDIANNPCSLMRKLCDNVFLIHIPLTFCSFAPEIIMPCIENCAITYGCNPSIAGILSPIITILMCGYSSYNIGEHVFPYLDYNYHSDVAWLKVFFGDKIRKNINRGESFKNSAIAQCLLSWIGQTLTTCQTLPWRITGYMAYAMKIPFYLMAALRVIWQKPIHRGAPDDRYNEHGKSYCLADLKVVKNLL